MRPDLLLYLKTIVQFASCLKKKNMTAKVIVGIFYASHLFFFPFSGLCFLALKQNKAGTKIRSSNSKFIAKSVKKRNKKAAEVRM